MRESGYVSHSQAACGGMNVTFTSDYRHCSSMTIACP